MTTQANPYARPDQMPPEGVEVNRTSRRVMSTAIISSALYMRSSAANWLWKGESETSRQAQRATEYEETRRTRKNSKGTTARAKKRDKRRRAGSLSGTARRHSQSKIK